MDSTTGPCAVWPVSGCGDLPAPTGSAVIAATEVLWQMSGQQFGFCDVEIRPCAQSCTPWWSTPWWWDSSWSVVPGLALVNVACGQCQSGCECSHVSAVILPGPVHEVLSVTVDGVELGSSEWWLQDYRRLIRIGGNWPLCQDFNVPASGEGAWSVMVRFGSPVPEIGIMAVTELANELILACSGSDECLIPPNAVSVVRGGVTYDMDLLFTYLEKGRTGMRMCDLFLSAFNPYGMQQRSRVYTPDR